MSIATQHSASFGPWAKDISESERTARLRSLRALVFVFCGADHALVRALQNAETDPAAAEEALREFDRLPALPRRRVLSVFANLRAPTPSSSPPRKEPQP